ncbi:hypothetical protein UFOVP270_9 [uncultured Caudovirales phage]|uniref:Uncharacterized protein n=1 Tax=uncultured Caudovirales phage TaxID=2100421 RepID=A0A6J5L5N8_9CAUD|nr:hypothetical protein UFOVP101_47 [uncultured Caudovirales phage]CAB4134040.1 hypothetical protein UFOVP270_9 [uncultured Caudovirales phage]
MHQIDWVHTLQVSGAEGPTASTEHWSIDKTIDCEHWTLTFDGSLPPELQARIDSGESFNSMKSDLMAWNIIIATLRTYHPEYFAA